MTSVPPSGGILFILTSMWSGLSSVSLWRPLTAQTNCCRRRWPHVRDSSLSFSQDISCKSSGHLSHNYIKWRLFLWLAAASGCSLINSSQRRGRSSANNKRPSTRAGLETGQFRRPPQGHHSTRIYWNQVIHRYGIWGIIDLHYDQVCQFFFCFKIFIFNEI